jgi:hypothetical protein
MKTSKRSVPVGSLLIILLAFAVATPLLGQNLKLTVTPAYHHDVSPPLSQLVGSLPASSPSGQVTIPLRPTRPLPGSNAPVGEDAALQKLPLPLVGTTNGLNFEGVSANGFAPPDTNGSVGLTQFVQITNVEFAVYDKTSGGILHGPALINSIWSGFGGDCDTGGNGGDPVAIWDKAAQRWVISQLAGNYNSWCMAVSQTSDATGSYYRYAFSSGGNLDDYPKVGVWPDAYYRATNTFQNKSNFIGAKACAFDRANMLSGGPANEICFQESSAVASLLPSDLDGNTPPPNGSPNYYLELLSTTTLGIFQFHVDFAVPANSTFTGPTTISVASYSELGSVPQPPGDGTQLDSLSDRLMFRLAYRNFGAYEALVVTHSVTAGSSGGARWYEIHSPGNSPTVFQQGTFAPDSTYRWMGSIAMDQMGDIALGYSASSSSVHPAVRYTGRVPSDPLGQMESEASIFEGSGSQTGGLSRWGDYSSISIDPTDDCTFWYTNEYIPSDGSFNWHTRIGSFVFLGCSGTAGWSLSAAPGSQNVTPGGTATYTVTATPFNGFSGTVNLSVSGCPTGATCSVNPTSLTLPPAGNSTLTVQTSSSTPTGNYTVTVSGNDGSVTHTTSVTVAVSSFTVTATPASQTVKKGSSTTYTAKVAAVNGFHGVVTLSVSALPSGATATFNPTSVTGSGNSILTISTTKKTSVGTFSLKISGNSGSLTQSATVSLKVSNNGK